MEDLKKHAPLMLRIGIGLIFLYIGLQMLFHPYNWTGDIPNWADTITEVDVLIFFVGLVNFIIGDLIILGLFTRVLAIIGALELFAIIVLTGFNFETVINFGLMMATVGLAMIGPGRWSVDHYVGRN